MSAPTPGPGWRVLAEGEQIPDDAEVLTWAAPHPAPVLQWVLTPTKLLPTAPGTLIHATEGALAGDWLRETVDWVRPGTTIRASIEDLQQQAGDYQIRAEPRSATAAAVLDYLQPAITDDWRTDAAKTFGVEDEPEDEAPRADA